MGDRAIVRFEGQMGKSPDVYLHWHGSAVPALLEGAASRMRRNDPTYACARFIGHCHTQIDGALSLGVANNGELAERLYVVNVDTGIVTDDGERLDLTLNLYEG